MTLELYSSSPDETVEAGLPQLRKAAEWVMWVLPTGPFWEPRDASRILNAFKDLRCIAWLASEGGGDTPAIRNHLRAFGQFAGAKKNILVQRTLNHLSSRKTIYSDIAWFDSQQGESLVSFLSRSTAGTDSTLSFILNDELSVENWSKAVAGLEWLWLLGNDTLTAPDTPLDADPVVSAYVQLTVRRKGVAGLVFSVSGKSGLALFGERRILEAAAGQITDGGQPAPRELFDQWYQHGLHLRAAP